MVSIYLIISCFTLFGNDLQWPAKMLHSLRQTVLPTPDVQTWGVYNVLRSYPKQPLSKLHYVAGDLLGPALDELERCGLIQVKRNTAGIVEEILEVRQINVEATQSERT
jgi:hypothetical protein